MHPAWRQNCAGAHDSRGQKAVEKGQAANMVGMDMGEENINFLRAFFQQAVGQTDKAGAAIANHPTRAMAHFHATCIAAKNAVVGRINRRRAACSPKYTLIFVVSSRTTSSDMVTPTQRFTHYFVTAIKCPSQSAPGGLAA